MSKKPTNPESPVSGEFAADVWKRAGESANAYSIVVNKTDDGWMARCVEIPTVFVFAKTAESAMKKIHEPLTVLVATMIEAKRALPSPMSEGKREAQVNVKLTAEERLMVEGAAKSRGFKGISDFFRFAALQVARA
jgi:predicted RNase H-like HicB family nuclease